MGFDFEMFRIDFDFVVLFVCSHRRTYSSGRLTEVTVSRIIDRESENRENNVEEIGRGEISLHEENDDSLSPPLSKY